MDWRKLRYFLEVVDDGTITGAARKLHLTQPALSRQIRAFEDEVGWRLFERGARSLDLTREGRVVAEEGEALLAEVERAEKRMRQRIEGAALRIGYSPSLAGGLITQALSCFQQRHEQARIELHDLSSEEMCAGLRRGELDLVVTVRQPGSEFTWRKLVEKAWRVAVPERHPLQSREELRAEDLDGERLLIYSRVDYPDYARLVTGFFRQNGLNAKVAGEFDGVESLRMALEAGMGLALVAAGTKFGSEGLKLLPLVPSP
ncbi:MAG: LysR family transcriptional regulator, partial [Verrucomicrobiales bacterium]